jgi:hypothetical protein
VGLGLAPKTTAWRSSRPQNLEGCCCCCCCRRRPTAGACMQATRACQGIVAMSHKCISQRRYCARREQRSVCM